MKSQRISRVVQLLTTLQAGRSYTADDLSKIFNTSRRTIFRDLKQLSEIGVPYRYSAKENGYTIDPGYFLPPLNLKLEEALALLLLVHKVRKQIHLPFEKAALLGALKIENNIPPSLRKYCNTALETISAKTHSKEQKNESLDKTFNSIQKAIMNKRKINLRYGSLHENSAINTIISPYHLLYNKRAWYLIGHSEMHDSVRTFKLSRIAGFEPLDKCFIDGEDFDLDDYLAGAWSMIPEGKIYRVRLKFAPKVAKNVTEIVWHKSQKHHIQPDGSAIVEFRVNGLEEIKWWILGYGDKVEVLAPMQLRQTITKTAQNIIKMYS